MSKKHKTAKEQQAEAMLQQEAVINNVLKFSRKRFKRFDEVILQLYRNENLSAFFTDARIKKLHDCFAKLASKGKGADRAAFKNALIYVEKNSELTSDETFIQAAFNIVLFRAYWQKNIFEWKPASKKADSQLKELAFYLFCKYSVPAFLYKAFFENGNTLFIKWFIHVGTGKRVKDLIAMPIPFTQKAGHWFLQAPSHLNVSEALRWAQVKGMNGDDKLAERVAYSWVGTKPYGNEVIWETFIRIIVTGGMFNQEKLTELIDYVREMLRVNLAYSLKGRTLQSLLRQSDEWHKQAMALKGAQFWNSSGIEGYKATKKEELVKLEELTGSKLLADEGRTMKHCVGSYVHYCVAGKTAIFSMRKYVTGLMIDTLATIEVNLALKRVVQAKAKMNHKISEETKRHLENWAEKAGLSVSPYL